MINTPLVSVLMTAYNREKYIAEAIESVMASTYQNWELIIVDDRSKDRTVEIAKKYEAKDKRIKVYINEKNLGDYPNRNKAASYAKGKYLKYVDADDMIYPNGLEIMVKYMEQFPEAALGLSRPDNDLKPFPYILSPKESIKEHFEKSLFTNAPTSTIIKKEAFDNIDGFSGTQYIGDTELWLKIGSKYPVLIFMRGLTWWRGHEDQQIKQEAEKTEPLINRFNLALDTIKNFEHFSDSEKKYYTNKECISLARYLLSISFRRKSFKTLIKVKRETGLELSYFFKAIFKRR